ncbi:MAG: hypothetical protein ABR543_19015 [Gemmatimonadaceae bacterium]
MLHVERQQSILHDLYLGPGRPLHHLEVIPERFRNGMTSSVGLRCREAADRLAEIILLRAWGISFEDSEYFVAVALVEGQCLIVGRFEMR